MGKKEIQQQWWRPALIMFSQVSGWIIGPIVAATLLGKYLDKKFDTHPYFWIYGGIIYFINGQNC